MAKVRGTEKQKADKSDSKKSSEIKTKKDSGTKSSDKVSLTSKLNKTSKIAISKTNKSPAISTRTIEVSFTQCSPPKIKMQTVCEIFYSFAEKN